MRAAELCAGYGGLALAVEHVFGAETVWVSEFEDAPSKILTYRFPGVPNHGDMTKIDWATVEPVDIISGGTPCQDLSAAGKRAGMTEGTRSNLWVQMREAIAIIKPTYVVWENVRGAYSAGAYSEMEQQEGRVGADGNPYLRALGRILGDLSDLGYDCQWRGLRAADVGAPHGRFRVFVLAAHTGRVGRHQAVKHDGRSAKGSNWASVPYESDSHTLRPRPIGEATQDAHLATGGEWRIATPGQAESGWAWADIGRRGGASTADANRGDDDGRINDQEWGEVPRTPATGRGGITAAHDSSPARRGSKPDNLGTRQEPATEPRECTSGDITWGAYEPAIRRWEQALGRCAPDPTELGKNGKHRLSARFCEWMMGVPDGWIVDVPGVSRNEALKAAGNGVVPQQAIAALQDMLRAI